MHRAPRRCRPSRTVTAARGLAFAALCAGCGETRGPILWAPDAGGATATVNLYGETATVGHGGPGGVMSVDTCPAREAVIGYAGSIGTALIVLTDLATGNMTTISTSVVGSIQTLCGSLALAADGTLATGPGDVLAARGQSQGSPWLEQCPSNEVVVGFFGRTGTYVDQIAFICAPPSLSAALDGGATTTTSLAPAGGDGGVPFDAETCPSGQIAVGTVTRSGAHVDSFGLLCATPTLNPDGGP